MEEQPMTDETLASDEEHMPQELADIFFATEDGHGGLDPDKVAALHELADAGLGAEAFG
jgi:hypothetical protein